MRIIILSNTAWYLYNFRLSLMKFLRDSGHEIIAISPRDHYVSKIEIEGFQHWEWILHGSSTGLCAEGRAVKQLYGLLKGKEVDWILSYTSKGNIYGALVARWIGARSLPNISGLGWVFSRDTYLSRIVLLLYRYTLGPSEIVFFQNREDKQFFLENKVIKVPQARCLPGSGVDLQRFFPHNKELRLASKCVFLLMARLLWDKGVGEFVEAARLVKKIHPEVECQLLGFLGGDNPSHISRTCLAQWEQEGVIVYLGEAEDVRPMLQRADCVVLPSYREGLPRSLLEAAAMAKPIITTDTVGCRDVVEEGVNGFLCALKDPQDLAQKMIQFVTLSPAQRTQMGWAGREKIEQTFDERLVFREYQRVLEETV